MIFMNSMQTYMTQMDKAATLQENMEPPLDRCLKLQEELGLDGPLKKPSKVKLTGDKVAELFTMRLELC